MLLIIGLNNFRWLQGAASCRTFGWARKEVSFQHETKPQGGAGWWVWEDKVAQLAPVSKIGAGRGKINLSKLHRFLA